MKMRIDRTKAYEAVNDGDVKDAIVDILSRGGTAELKTEHRNDTTFVTVVEQTRHLAVETPVR